MSDEHDYAVTGAYGDKIVDTRNLDRLAADGITFDGCYTTSPLCVPARLSFTAGKYVSRCGAWSNDCWLPSDDYPSLPSTMSAAGYRSVLCGKMHYDRDRRYGFDEIFPSEFNAYTKHGRGVRIDPEHDREEIQSWINRSGDFHVGNDSRVLAHDRKVTAEACRFLRTRKPDDAPFFMLAGYLSPHFPLIVPTEFYDKYRGRVPMPEIPEGLLDKLPTNYRTLRRAFGVVAPDPETVKRGRELYWALVDWMDKEIGKLLSALAESTAADNTVIIYTSDHGENKGDHGMWWKNNMFEHSAGIPLIVSFPSRFEGGQRRTGACSLVDLVKTIAEIGDAEIPDDWDGDSLLDWIKNPGTAWKDMAVSEYYAHNISSGFSMLRQGDFKYVYHTRIDNRHGSEVELYDLKNDPREFENLARNPRYRERIGKMHAALVAEVGRDPEDVEAQCRHDYVTGYRR